MADMIATLLSTAKVIPQTNDERDLKGPLRHIYRELKDLQQEEDPELTTPYLKASAVSTLVANGETEGNFTLTINFPKQGVSVTTGEIGYNADDSDLGAAIDLALSGQTIIGTYVAEDIYIGNSNNVATDNCTITANGSTVNGAYMEITATAVDLGSETDPTVTSDVIGTQNRPAEAVLHYFDVIVANELPQPQNGSYPTSSTYYRGDNPESLSPSLIRLLIEEIQTNQDEKIGEYFRENF
jgi:hypothetical protein